MLRGINNNHAMFWEEMGRKSTSAKKGFVKTVSFLTYMGMRMGQVNRDLSAAAAIAVALYTGVQLKMHSHHIRHSLIVALGLSELFLSTMISSSDPKIIANSINRYN